MTAIVKSVRCAATDILYASSDCPAPKTSQMTFLVALQKGILLLLTRLPEGNQCGVFVSIITQKLVFAVFCEWQFVKRG